MAAKKKAAKDISDLLKKGILKHRIAHTFPLSEIAKGHRLIEQGGFVGCVVLSCE